MIEAHEWRQLGTALSTASMGKTQDGTIIIDLVSVLQILKTFTIPGCDFEIVNGAVTIKWPGHFLPAPEPKKTEPSPA